MRKLSSHPRAKSYVMPKGMEGRRYSIVEELQNHAYDTDSNGDLGTPNSQNMTDTDPPSKPSITLTKPRVLSHGNVVMEGIPEDAELDRSGDDDDYNRWNNYVNSREVSEGLLNEITGMKSDVRREIEVMGGKMNQLEQNISTILRLLQEKGLDSTGSGFVSPLGNLQAATKTAEAPRSRTASIISRVKAEMPEDVLPAWVEMENYGMATVAKDNNETAKPEEEEEEEKHGEEEVKPKKIGGRITKKRQLEAKRRKKKAGKTTSKHDSDEEHEVPEVHHDDLLDAPLPEYVETPAPGETAEQVSSEKAGDHDTMPLLNEPKVKKEKPKQKKKKGEKPQVALEMNDIPHQSEPEIQKNQTQGKLDDDLLKPDDDSLKPGDTSLKPEDDSLKPTEGPGRPSSSNQQEEAQESKNKRKKKKSAKRSKDEDKKDTESDGAPQAVTKNEDAHIDENSAKPDSSRPESPTKVPERNEPESKEESGKLDDDGDSKQSQPAQPEETEHPENERSLSPVADSQQPPSRANTARKSSARSQKDNSPEEKTQPTEETSANEETSPSGSNTPRAQSPKPEQENKPSSRVASPVPEDKDKPSSRVASPEPEQENKPPSRAVSPKPDEQRLVTPGETTPGRQSRQSNDVALTIEDSDEDNTLLPKKEKPKYVV